MAFRFDLPPKAEKQERLVVTSELERPDGTHPEFHIDVLSDGKPKIIAFWDVDKTLVNLEGPMRAIRPAMWPEAFEKDDLEEVSAVHLAGYQLGNMWRELYRMYGIYTQGKRQWNDPAAYEADFLAPGKDGEHIDKAGDSYHEFADKLLQRFDGIATRVIDEQYQKDPHTFDHEKIKPMYHLAEVYRRLGNPQVGMSANPRGYIRAVCKYLGLSEYFIDCATDTDVAGLKEHKMKYLTAALEAKGIQVPYDRLVIVGDSPTGDVGSGPRFRELMHKEKPAINVVARGLLVVENAEALRAAEEKIGHDPELRQLVETLRWDKVKPSRYGVPAIGSRYDDGFLEPLKSPAERKG